MNKALEKQIRQLDDWYQKIELEGIQTSIKGGPYYTMEESSITWKKILRLYSDFKDKKILDLGCNAGYYSIMAAKNGASVTGIEYSSHFYKQALFLRKYYENLWNSKLNINCINKDISDVNLQEIGKFDCIFAFSIFYHIGKLKYGKETPEALAEQYRLIKYFSNITDKFIIRSRNGKNRDVNYYDNVFKKLNFKNEMVIPEGKRSFILYVKK